MVTQIEVKIEPSRPTAECPESHLWKSIDADTCELEVVVFLKYLVMLLKPRYILETGTCYGFTANAMAESLERGKLTTCDPEKKWAELHERVEYLQCESLSIVPTEPIDLLFLDSLTDIRVKEYFHFKPYLSSRAVVVIHDAGSTHPELLAGIMKLIPNELNGVFLPTPRGLFIGRPK